MSQPDFPSLSHTGLRSDDWSLSLADNPQRVSLEKLSSFFFLAKKCKPGTSDGFGVRLRWVLYAVVPTGVNCSSGMRGCSVWTWQGGRWCFSYHTVISSPRQLGVSCLLRTLSSLMVSKSVPQPKISMSSSSSSSSSLSSLSSEFDSYSEAMPDSRNLAKSRQPRDSTSFDNNADSSGSWPLPSGKPERGGGGGPGRKRKQSRLRRHWSLPSGLPMVPLVDEKTLLVESEAPSVGRLTLDTSGFGVVGSQITAGTVERKVISNKLSWDPTEERGRGEFRSIYLHWRKLLHFIVQTIMQLSCCF